MFKFLGNILRPFNKMPASAMAALGAAGILAIGIVDYFTGYEIALSIFYLAPICLVAWTKGRVPGYALAALGALTWLAADLLVRHPYSHSAIPFWNAAVRLGFFTLFVTALTSLRDALAHERDLARVDYITQLYNSRTFYEYAAVEIERCRRYGRPFAAAYMDIDYFKRFNDNCGHNAGDECLRRAAEVIKGHVREADMAARLGGDEFAVLMPETTTADAVIVMHRMLVALDTATSTFEPPVSFSVGVVGFVHPPVDVDNLIKRVDAIMYRAKVAGRNRLRFATD